MAHIRAHFAQEEMNDLAAERYVPVRFVPAEALAHLARDLAALALNAARLDPGSPLTYSLTALARAAP